ncbi:MAG: hypothetical protein CVV41_06725 [Candidatus Riflebacteria bacterium HGW-Riflebacteria-1]|jgi:phage gpG-like protein|nr:MAG: hypothetical protein CVV41_06725 [Candidatus Riflebacteria bacterium HGW-Riflebacteria-1]
MTTELIWRDEQVKELLNTIVNRIGDASEALNAIGDEMISSVEENFAAGGRYSSPEDIVGGDKKWQALSRTTLAIKERKGLKGPHQILIESGGMVASIGKSKKVDKNTVSISAGKEYAAMQHFGAKKGEFGIHDVLIKAHVSNMTQHGQRVGKNGKLGKARDLAVSRSVRGHFRKQAIPWGDVPARPFMTLHPSNIENIIGMLADYIASEE